MGIINKTVRGFTTGKQKVDEDENGE